jgi:Rhomboid family
MVWRCFPRSTTDRLLFRGTVQQILLPRHAHLLRTAVWPLRALTPVRNFHATDFFSATHRTTVGRPHHRRDWQSPGPLRRLRQKFDAIPPNYLIFCILGINGVVFAAWTYIQMFQVRAPPPAKSSRPELTLTLAHVHMCTQNVGYNKLPPSVQWLARCLQNNFINSYENLRKGRLCVWLPRLLVPRPSAEPFFFFSHWQIIISWTLVTSTFSHAQPGHALFNGLTFWFLAPTALAVLGNAQFLALYLGSASPPSLSSPPPHLFTSIPHNRWRICEHRVASME